MSAAVVGGPRVWAGSRDDDGYREFTVTHLVKTTSVSDCPYTVMFASGLPAIGSVWNFGTTTDFWAFCYPYMKVSLHEHKAGDPHFWYAVDQKFSTKPMKRCQDTQVEDPLLEPQQVRGNFGKYTIEAVYDRNGSLIKSSSHEQIRGRQVEFDNNKPTVSITQNVASLGLSTFSQMIDTVNDGPMWGLSARMVKLSNAPWERKVYGKCHYYYTRTFDFDIDYRTFDRNALDEGTKVLRGHWVGANGGTGFTVNILTLGVTLTPPTVGIIRTISLASGGSGYPANKSFQLTITGGSGTGGIVLATTNSAGVVTAVSLITGGKNYVVTAASTEEGTKWVLDNDPDYTNPQDFIRYKDVNGENTRAILNGSGTPILNASEAARIPVAYYGESNMFTLGIPTSF
jgi:hypothetical protein